MDKDEAMASIDLGDCRVSKWSALSYDLILNIIDRLPLPDCSRFGSVCSSWRSALRHLTRPPPLVICFHYHPFGYRCSFFAIYHGQCQPVRLRLSPSPGVRWHGFSKGWIVASDANHARYFLSNPVSRQQIDLPPTFTMNCAALSSSAPASDVDCVLIACDSGAIASCKPAARDKEWRVVSRGNRSVCSMAMHKGKLYVHPRYGDATDVYDPDVDGFPRLIGVVPKVAGSYLVFWLVESGEDLLLVACRRLEPRAARDMRVFRLEEGGWVGVGSLGKRMLFLSDRWTESISAEGIECWGLRGDCIYFRVNTGPSDDLQVYSMQDGSFQTLPLSHHCSPALVGFLPLPFW